jgi:CRP-like cAMP-binding protein
MSSVRLTTLRITPHSVSGTNPTLAERVVLMCASALFAGLKPEECLQIAAWAKARSFIRDELLFMQGQPVRNLVLLQTGSVKQTQISSAGAEVILWMNGKGDAVGVNSGESAFSSHTCSARALETCKALTWEYSKLQSLLAEHPQIRTNINQILSNRIQELEERFREIATEKVAKRLAQTLLRLLKSIGKEHQLGVQVSLSREELAQMTGTTLFTISRILSKWSDEGFILPRREAVVVSDPSRLGRIGDED